MVDSVRVVWEDSGKAADAALRMRVTSAQKKAPGDQG
jgi:hypothetical protein